jgi:hypothetical protein
LCDKDKKEGFLDKMKDKLGKGGENKKSDSKEAGEAKKHHEGLGKKLEGDMHKFEEYSRREEQKEASDQIWGQGT